MSNQKVLNIYEFAELLGTTSAAIRSHWQRRNFDAIPRPIHLGRRLGWPMQIVEDWLQKKIEADSIWQ
ncbi:hypothetical protein SYK_16300 [Pseudodesulfovibrio nedwellii]|uniref:Helix-turn-helix domain-containing protein n=1 Tax=Pseudodesulfovibrio nedwellii TaxID=2973072 RepID=A0ABM8B0F9_9BACT|nr:hypothetical protein [Pseudodesulfovibrio nedwellii]BDQ37270.1 hypothetical protein SYK_16300 [Pseudodesulfovibrio nedwellii]